MCLVCVGPRSRRLRVPHACHVRAPRPRTSYCSPLTHTRSRPPPPPRRPVTHTHRGTVARVRSQISHFSHCNPSEVVRVDANPSANPCVTRAM
eukprot:3508919-Prymnesium_polylepis.1